MTVVSTPHAVYEGTALDLRETGIDAETLVAAVRSDVRDTSDPARPRPSSDPDTPLQTLEVTCPSPTPPHEVLGHVDGRGSSLRALLAAAARSRGHTAPQRPRYEAVVERLQTLAIPDIDVTTARRRVADAGAEEGRLREQMATLRGRLQARRETGVDTEAVATDLAETASRLSEVETERIAAEQALDRQERRAAEVRQTRERRLELEDSAANLERQMRASLAERLYPEFRETFETLPVEGQCESDRVNDTPDEFEGDRTSAHLVAVHLADLNAPVVVSSGSFERAETAARVLDTSVILL